jgi:hypothetical protein
MVPMMGRKHRAISGVIMGRLLVTTATKVSRTAQDPACCAPLTGSLVFCVSVSVVRYSRSLEGEEKEVKYRDDEYTAQDRCRRNEHAP